MSIRVCFYLSLKDNIIRLDVDEEGVRKGGKGRERREEGWMGEEFASVAETRLLVYRSFVWDLAICTWFYVCFFFRSLFFLSLSPSSFTCNDYINNSM